MKKAVKVLLIVFVMFALAGCNQKEKETPAIAGGYHEAEDKTLTPELTEIFDKAFEGFTGVGYTPVRLEATQVVAGINYKFLAEGISVTEAKSQGTYYVYIYRDLQGNVSLLNIEKIEPAAE